MIFKFFTVILYISFVASHISIIRNSEDIPPNDDKNKKEDKIHNFVLIFASPDQGWDVSKINNFHFDFAKNISACTSNSGGHATKRQKPCNCERKLKSSVASLLSWSQNAIGMNTATVEINLPFGKSPASRSLQNRFAVNYLNRQDKSHVKRKRRKRKKKHILKLQGKKRKKRHEFVVPSAEMLQKDAYNTLISPKHQEVFKNLPKINEDKENLHPPTPMTLNDLSPNKKYILTVSLPNHPHHESSNNVIANNNDKDISPVTTQANSPHQESSNNVIAINNDKDNSPVSTQANDPHQGSNNHVIAINSDKDNSLVSTQANDHHHESSNNVIANNNDKDNSPVSPQANDPHHESSNNVIANNNDKGNSPVAPQASVEDMTSTEGTEQPPTKQPLKQKNGLDTLFSPKHQEVLHNLPAMNKDRENVQSIPVNNELPTNKEFFATMSLPNPPHQSNKVIENDKDKSPAQGNIDDSAMDPKERWFPPTQKSVFSLPTREVYENAFKLPHRPHQGNIFDKDKDKDNSQAEGTIYNTNNEDFATTSFSKDRQQGNSKSLPTLNKNFPPSQNENDILDKDDYIILPLSKHQHRANIENLPTIAKDNENSIMPPTVYNSYPSQKQITFNNIDRFPPQRHLPQNPFISKLIEGRNLNKKIRTENNQDDDAILIEEPNSNRQPAAESSGNKNDLSNENVNSIKENKPTDEKTDILNSVKEIKSTSDEIGDIPCQTECTTNNEVADNEEPSGINDGKTPDKATKEGPQLSANETPSNKGESRTNVNNLISEILSSIPKSQCSESTEMSSQRSESTTIPSESSESGQCDSCDLSELGLSGPGGFSQSGKAQSESGISSQMVSGENQGKQPQDFSASQSSQGNQCQEFGQPETGASQSSQGNQSQEFGLPESGASQSSQGNQSQEFGQPESGASQSSQGNQSQEFGQPEPGACQPSQGNQSQEFGQPKTGASQSSQDNQSQEFGQPKTGASQSSQVDQSQELNQAESTTGQSSVDNQESGHTDNQSSQDNQSQESGESQSTQSNQPKDMTELMNFMGALRNSFLHSFFEPIWMPENSEAMSPSLYNLVKKMMVQLKELDAKKGYIAVVKGGTLVDLNNPQSGTSKTLGCILNGDDEKNIILSASCPEKNKKCTSLPLFVSGPLSGEFENVEELADIPKVIKQYLLKNYRQAENIEETKNYLSGHSGDKKRYLSKHSLKPKDELEGHFSTNKRNLFKPSMNFENKVDSQHNGFV